MVKMFSDKHWVLEAVVAASPEIVFQQIVVVKTAEVAALGSEYTDALATDDAHLTVSLTGHWWYQGVHTVRSHPRGSQVTYTVRNVAQVARTVAFLQRPFYPNQMRQDFEQLLRRIGAQIGCAWTLERGS